MYVVFRHLLGADLSYRLPTVAGRCKFRYKFRGATSPNAAEQGRVIRVV
jgi:hypothetical protein